MSFLVVIKSRCRFGRTISSNGRQVAGATTIVAVDDGISASYT